MPNALIISPYFPPSTLAGVHRARHLAKYLPGAGWHPIVLCVDEAHHEQRLDPDLHSEIDFMNGLVCEKGREVAVSTPFHDAVVDAMHGIDDGSVKPSPDNVDRVLRAAGR